MNGGPRKAFSPWLGVLITAPRSCHARHFLGVLIHASSQGIHALRGDYGLARRARCKRKYFLFFWYLSTWIYLHYLADACIPAPPPSQEYFFKYFLYALLLNLTSNVAFMVCIPWMTNHDSATVLRAPSWAWNRPLSKHLGGFFFRSQRQLGPDAILLNPPSLQ